MVEKELNEACKTLTGLLLTDWGGVDTLANLLGTHRNNIDQLKNGKKPNPWLVRHIKYRASIQRVPEQLKAIIEEKNGDRERA